MKELGLTVDEPVKPTLEEEETDDEQRRAA